MTDGMTRRTALFALSATVASACVAAKPAAGLRLDPKAWAAYKARFFLPEGRIADSGNGGVSHSEGQGYGLLLAQAAGDRAAFDALLGWTERVLARQDVALFSWRYVPGADDPVPDRNNATDGDLLIAWALMLAARRWGHGAYAARAAEIRGAAAAHLLVRQAGMSLLLPGIDGFRHDGRITLNPSYYVWPALDAFAAADRNVWAPVEADGLHMLSALRFGAKALPADWVEMTADGRTRPDPAYPPRFGFEGVRIPLYLLLSGRRTGAEAIRRFWTSATPPPAWIDLRSGEVAPYPLPAGGRAIAARLNGLSVAAAPADGDYYSASLGLLASMIR